MRLALLVVFFLCACDATTPAPSPSAQTPAPPLPAPSQPGTTISATRVVALTSGLVVDVPAAWTLGRTGYVNMATNRYLFAGNGDLDSLATREGNGDVDPATIPADRVVVEIEAFCRLACSGAPAETSLPLDWSAAAPRTPALPAGRHQQWLSFRWFDQPFYVIATWNDLAPAADVAAIARVVRSIRPEDGPPTTGEFMGWQGLGPLSAIPIGSVSLTRPPVTTATGPRPLYGTGPYFLARGQQNVYAFSTRPLADSRCEIEFDAAADRFWCQIGARRVEWTHFGRFLGPEPASDLIQYRVIVREGLVWVRYLEPTRFTPSVQDEDSER